MKDFDLAKLPDQTGRHIVITGGKFFDRVPLARTVITGLMLCHRD
jgi:hypothetical protein